MNGIRWAYCARHGAQHAEGRGDRVAAALDRELHDVLGVEVGRVLGEGGARRVLDALVHGQDRDVAGARQAAVVEELLQAAQHRASAGPRRPGRGPRSRGPGRCRVSFGMPLQRVLQQRLGVGAQVLLDRLSIVPLIVVSPWSFVS